MIKSCQWAPGEVMSAEDDAEIARLLAMGEAELQASLGVRGSASKGAVTSLNNQAVAEVMERALFGATLDDILSASDLTDLEVRRRGAVRPNQTPRPAGLEPARPRGAESPDTRSSQIVKPTPYLGDASGRTRRGGDP
jgi:hypothetical protein